MNRLNITLHEKTLLTLALSKLKDSREKRRLQNKLVKLRVSDLTYKDVVNY